MMIWDWLASELRLDNEAAIAVVRKRLEATGLKNLHIHGEITPFSISHNVVNGQQATKDCTNCHGGVSVLEGRFSAI